MIDSDAIKRIVIALESIAETGRANFEEDEDYRADGLEADKRRDARNEELLRCFQEMAGKWEELANHQMGLEQRLKKIEEKN
jgi:hypothetical protein